jgi:hypothetical protein
MSDSFGSKPPRGDADTLLATANTGGVVTIDPGLHDPRPV